MFKHFQLLLLLIFLSSAAYGQRISFGVKGGINYSNQTFMEHSFLHPTMGRIGEESRFTFNSKTGLKLGVFADIGLSRYFSLAPGLLYNQKGINWNYLYYDVNQPPYFNNKNNKVTLDYLSFDLPLMIKLKRERWIPYVLIGSRVDVLLGYRQSLTQLPSQPEYEGYNGYHRDLKKVNFGLLTAVGIEKRLNPGMNVFLELEYNPSIASNKEWRRINNSMFALNGGIRWGKN